MGCCAGGYGCVPPCPSQFDAIGCQFSSLSLDDKRLEAPSALPDNLYRILRPDENPKGIIAKDPSAQKTVLSLANCGSRPKYASQFISTSASLDVAKYYKEKGEENGLTGLRICKFEVDKLPTTCLIVDLSTEENRDKERQCAKTLPKPRRRFFFNAPCQFHVRSLIPRLRVTASGLWIQNTNFRRNSSPFWPKF